MAEPVEYRIAVHIVAALAAISTGGGYTMTVHRAYLAGEPLAEQPTYPAAVLVPLGVDVDTETRDLQDAVVCLAKFMVVAAVPAGTDVVKRVHRLVSDVHRAIMVDPTRGGDAVTTWVRRWEEEYPVDSLSEPGLAVVEIEVPFRTASADLTVAV